MASWFIQPIGHNRHGPKTGGVPPLGGGLGPHLTQCRLLRGLPPHQVGSWSIQPFGHNEYGLKIGGLYPLSRSPSNRNSPWPRATSVPSGILIYAGHNGHGPKIARLCPFWGWKAGSLSNTTWPRSSPTRMPIFKLIRPTVWPQYTNVTDRQDRTWQDRQTNIQHDSPIA